MTNCMPLAKSLRKEGGVTGVILPGSLATNTKIKHRAYKIPLSQKTPNIPTNCNIIPPKRGPSIRVAFPVAESNPIAFETFSPARSPSRRRLMGISVAQKTPLIKDAIANKK